MWGGDPLSAAEPSRGRWPPERPHALLHALRDGARIDLPACVVVAHPDDESLGLGGRLANLRRLTVIQVTDGAPHRTGHAHRAGFPDPDAYRQARRAERDAALAQLGVRARPVELGLRDQGAAEALGPLALRLASELRSAALVITHAYEGGHPDHDAAAFAVQAACRILMRDRRQAPLRLEFAGYHEADGRRVTGAFWPDPDRAEVHARLTRRRLARKRAALACFQSQAGVVRWFDPAVEAYRLAPDYDFTAPPPPGRALYDGWGWPLTSVRWRAHAGEALATLRLEARRWV